MKRTILYAGLALTLAVMACISTPTPAPSNPGSGGSVPYGYNEETVDGAYGESSIPVQCDSENGDISIPAGAFSGAQTISIECVSPAEVADLDAKVKQQTGESNQALGAVRFEPSPFSFNTDVTIVIPLIQQRTDLANKYVDLYVYAPNVSGKLRYIKQARVDGQGRTATAKVNHFSTFILVNPLEDSSGPVEPPTEAPATFTCEDPLGCIDVAPGEPLRIASLLDFTGQKEYAAKVLDGIEGAISDYGQIDSHTIENIRVDSACNQEAGANAAYQIESDPQIVGTIGTICSASAVGAIPILSKADSVMISPLNTRTSLTYEDHYPGYYRVASPDILQAYFMAEFAYYELGVRYLAVYLEDDTFGRTMADGFVERFNALGGKIIVYSTVPPYDPDTYNALTNSLRDEGVQAIYMALTNENAGMFTLYMREFGLDVPLLGTDAINTDAFYDNAGSSTYNVFFPDSDPSPFTDTYSYGYDAAYLLLEAITRAAVVDGNGVLHIGRQTLRTILFEISLGGKTGSLKCNERGDCGHVPMVIYIIKEGNVEDVHRYTP